MSKGKAYIDGKIGGGSGVSDYSQLSNKPKINGVELNGNKTSDDLQIYSQYTTMPTASASYAGKVTQYIGTSTSTYTHGFFYECSLDQVEQVYKWRQVNVQNGSGVIGERGVQVVDNVASIKLQTVSNGLVVDDNGLSISLATTSAAGAMSAEDKTSLAGKQDKLTAGTNITIDENNVISASGGSQIQYIELEGWSETEGWHDGGTITDAQAAILTANEMNYIWMNGMHRLDFRYKDENNNLATYSSNDGVKTHVIEVTLSTKAWRYSHTVLAKQSELSDKQDKLIAGSNISIAADGKTISATDTTYTAGNDISIVDNAINVSAGVVEVTGTSGTFTDEQAQLLSNSSLAYISLDGKRFNASKVVVGRSGVVALYTSVVDSDLSSIEFNITSKAWVLRTTTLQSALTAGDNVQISDNVISATDTKYTAGTNITIDENNVISATGGGSVDFDNKTIIKGTDNKYQTAIGGWKETTPEQVTELFVNTKGNGLPTYFGPSASPVTYEVGWDYTTRISDLITGSNASININVTILGAKFNDKVDLTKSVSIPANWESDTITIGGKGYKVKIGEGWVGINQGGLTIMADDPSTDISDSTMESCALVTGSGSTVYHPIDNKFLKIDNSLAVDADNKLKVNNEVVQYKLTAGTNITIDENNVISATGSGASYQAGNGISIDSNTISTKLGNGLKHTESGNITLQTADRSISVGEFGIHVPVISTSLDVTDNGLAVKIADDSIVAYNSGTGTKGIKVNTDKIQSKLTAGSNITIDSNNVISSTGGGKTYTAGQNIQISSDDVISATDTKYTAGTNITIDSNNVISASGGSSVLTNPTTTSITVGGVAAGTTYPAGTSLESIILAMLGGSTPATNVKIYKGIVNSVPTTAAEIEALTLDQSKSKSALLSDPYAYKRLNPNNQFVVLAIPQSSGLYVSKIEVNGFGIGFNESSVGDYYLYYEDNPVTLTNITYEYTFEEV